MQTCVIRIEAIGLERFDEAFSIMEQSFPPDEMRPYGEQKALLSNERYKIFAAYDESEQMTSFAATWQLDDVLFIEHLATSPTSRGQGIGAKLLSYLTICEKRTVCLEAEPPESNITRRRIGFYNRNGFYLNEYPYIQPPISKGRNPVPLMIMTYGKRIDGDKFIKIRDLLYKEVYHTDKIKFVLPE